jgi:hypothetical protein
MNGTITATCAGWYTYGAGIGTGLTDSSSATVTNLTITGGIVAANWDGPSSSGRGIGPGDGGTVGLLHFSGNVTVKSRQLQASSIHLSDGSLLFVTDHASLFVVAPSVYGTVDLTILFSVVPGSLVVAWLNRSVLHIGKVSGLDDAGWALCLLSSKVERCFSDQFVPVRSLAVSVPGEDL